VDGCGLEGSMTIFGIGTFSLKVILSIFEFLRASSGHFLMLICQLGPVTRYTLGVYTTQGYRIQGVTLVHTLGYSEHMVIKNWGLEFFLKKL